MSIFDDIGAGLSGWLDDVTGKTQREDRDRTRSAQDAALADAQSAYDTGAGMLGSARDYWNNWLTNPSGAYNSTLGAASGVGGAMGGMATNSAVNTARASGLNAGQAALAGGAQAANAFTQGTLGAQQQMINQGQQSAQGSAAAGTTAMGQGLDAQVDISGQRQDQQQYDTDRNDKGWGGLMQTIRDPLGGGNGGGGGDGGGLAQTGADAAKMAMTAGG